MGDDGAEDTGDVSRSEGDGELLLLGALGFRFRDDVLVEGLVFKFCEVLLLLKFSGFFKFFFRFFLVFSF